MIVLRDLNDDEMVWCALKRSLLLEHTAVNDDTHMRGRGGVKRKIMSPSDSTFSFKNYFVVKYHIEEANTVDFCRMETNTQT